MDLVLKLNKIDINSRESGIQNPESTNTQAYVRCLIKHSCFHNKSRFAPTSLALASLHRNISSPPSTVHRPPDSAGLIVIDFIPSVCELQISSPPPCLTWTNAGSSRPSSLDFGLRLALGRDLWLVVGRGSAGQRLIP